MSPSPVPGRQSGRQPTHVLLDLDGTLSDPREGIVRCIQHALSALGREPIEDSALLWCIGPPLHQSFARILGGETEATRAVELYRERFAHVGIHEQVLYEGASTALRALNDTGFTLLLATSKPRVYAERIVSELGLAPFLEGVYGAELDGRLSDKADLIAHVLRSEDLAPTQCVMVGDRKHDLEGAKANSVPGVGVSWGYGSREELLACEPDALVEDFAHLLAYFDTPR